MELCKSDSIKELATALCKAQALMEGAKKESKNPYYKSRYASLEEVWACARKPLTENGLSVVQLPGKSELGHFLETVLLHSSGEFISGRMFISPIKESPQDIASAITYARRYSLMSCLGIAPEDDDGESAMGRGHTPTQEKKEPLPGSKASGWEEKPITAEEKKIDWQAFVWHAPFGDKKDKTYPYVGHTLAEIRLNDPAGFAYWVKKYAPTAKRGKALVEDEALRHALDAAREELAAKEAAGPSEADEPQVAPKEEDEQPSPAEKDSLVHQIETLCKKNKMEPQFIMDILIEKRIITPQAKGLGSAPEEALQRVVDKFSWFVAQYPKD